MKTDMTRILIVDDDVDLLRLIELKLRQEGYAVDLAENGFDGLRTSVETPPDLVILDVMMPEMDGWEFCERFRETSNAPILMLTARSEDEDVIKGFRVGADEYLTKPFRLNTLSSHIEALLRRQIWEQKTVQTELEALKSNIVSALSHELRTPVALILNALELSLREAFKQQPEAQRNFIREARENAEYLRWLIEDLLLLVRIDEGLELLARPTSLHHLLRQTITRSEKALDQRGIEARLICEEDVPLLVDQVLFRQALHHLFSNALMHSPENGQILVMVRQPEEEIVHIDFHDQGAGIPDQLQERIFDRFFQIPEEQQWKNRGLGIGLHIAREISRSHGGDVTVHSKVGEGSTFRLILPTGQTAS